MNVSAPPEYPVSDAQDPEEGSGLLFWGWIIVSVLNLGMVSVSLALFAP
jgi:hypothetical protein